MQILEEAAQNPRDKNRAKEDLAAYSGNTLITLFPGLFLRVIRNIFQKQKPFQVSGKLRLSDWHINKSLKNKTKLNQDILL